MTAAIVEQVVELATAVEDLQTTAVSYTGGVVTSVDKVSMTFAANVPQPDGTTVEIAGIGVTSAQFLPVVGQTVSLALSGAQLIYQPVGITPGSIGLGQASTDGPGVPGGLAVTSAAAQNADGTTGATITATWTAPTTNLSGGPVTEAPSYVVASKPTAKTSWTERPATALTSTFPVVSGTGYDVRVCSLDRLGNRSAWTAIQPITAGVDTAAPGALSTPLVDNYLGQLRITWDGKLFGGGAVPSDFLDCRVYVSTTSGFTPSGNPAASMTSGGTVTVDATPGTTMYVKFLGRDLSFNVGVASAQASGVTSKIVSDDMLAGAVGAAQLADLAVSNAKILDGAVGTSKLANLAVTSAIIGDAAVTNAKIALLAVATANIADLAVSNAKIGNLAVNDAKIGSLSAGKITAGTMSADVAISGRFTTALTGMRIEVNGLGVQGFRADNTKWLSLTNTESLMTGEFKTATSGRRIEIGTSGAYGEVQFYAASPGPYLFVRAYTEPNGIESIQLGNQIGGHYLYNKININDDGFLHWHGQHTELCHMNTGAFVIREYTSNAVWNTNFTERMTINNLGMFYNQPGNVRRFDFTSNGSAMFKTNGQSWFDQLQNVNGGNTLRWFPAGSQTGTGSIEMAVVMTPPATQSPRLAFFQGDTGGFVLKSFAGWAEHRDLSDAVFYGTRASVFEVNSDAAGKEQIVDADLDAIGIVKKLRVRKYRRKSGKDGEGNDLPERPEEIGLVTQESPPEIVSTEPASDGTSGISLYQYLTIVAASVQQIIPRLEALEKVKAKS